MRTALTRLVGPTLLIGSVAAVWIAVGLGPTAPLTTQAATSQAVSAVPHDRPSQGTLLAVVQSGDRLLVQIRDGSTSAWVQVDPGASARGLSLSALRVNLAGGEHPLILLSYGPDGSVQAITAA